MSVCVITYNHGAYIDSALKGILMQKVNFDFEILIGDDCSKDNTVSVIESYMMKHNNIILIRNNPNLGVIKNFFNTLSRCRGKFIAICEGDDYWTDEHKLQKQINYLTENSGCSICFHNAKVIYENSDKSHLFNTYDRKVYTGADMFTTWLIPTASAVFRNNMPKSLPSFFKRGTHGDFVLFLYLSEFGTIDFLAETMSVYRINDGGVTQSAFKGIRHNVQHISQLKALQAFFKRKYSKQINSRIAGYLMSTGYLFAKQKKLKNSYICFKHGFRRDKLKFLSSLKYIFASFYYAIK